MFLGFTDTKISKNHNLLSRNNLSFWGEHQPTQHLLPIDKGKPNKSEMSNLRPVSVLNVFSNIYEWATKDQIVGGMENFFHRFYLRIGVVI